MTNIDLKNGYKYFATTSLIVIFFWKIIPEMPEFSGSQSVFTICAFFAGCLVVWYLFATDPDEIPPEPDFWDK